MSETYTRINWKDGENGGTPISADNLNLMDLGIEKAHQLIEELKENGVGGVTEEQLKNAVDAYFIKNPIQTVSDIFMRVSDGYIQFSTDNLTWKNVIAVSELKGQTGKTAYEYAKDGGYTGTEEEFAKKLAQENPTREEFSQLSDTVNDLKENGTGSGATTAMSESLWAIIQKTAFVEQLTDAELTAFKTAWGIETGGEVEPDIPEDVTLTSISATYTGGNVPVGTSVNSLTGLTVTAIYSDGSTASVTGYTLSGTIAEGSNTITISYGGKTTTFTVTGVAESADENVYTLEEVTTEYWDYALNITSSTSYRTYKFENVKQGDTIVYQDHWNTSYKYPPRDANSVTDGEYNLLDTFTSETTVAYSYATSTFVAAQDYDVVYVCAVNGGKVAGTYTKASEE